MRGQLHNFGLDLNKQAKSRITMPSYHVTVNYQKNKHGNVSHSYKVDRVRSHRVQFKNETMRPGQSFSFLPATLERPVFNCMIFV